MTTAFNSIQKTYALSTLAGTPSDQHGTVAQLEAYASKVINATLKDTTAQGLIGQWDLVWGPAVYQTPGSDVADNAFYIAQNSSSPNEFVIAISGTNPISRYGWIHEDFLINPLQPWPFASGDSTKNSDIKISNGTHLGLTALLALTSNNQTALEYLATHTSAQGALEITITGHSLGGALSPAMALAMHDLQNNPVSWDPKGNSQIAVVPSAGPAAGNQAWANYYDQCLASTTTRLWNSIDIVPHAWEVDLLRQIPSLYIPAIAPSSLIEGLSDIAIANSILAGTMLHECSDTQPLAGTVNTNLELTLANIITYLEITLSNKIIEKVGQLKHWSTLEITLLKDIVDDLIQQLRKKSATEKLKINELHHHFASFSLKKHTTHASPIKSIYDFIEFLLQAGYQHTTAYNTLLEVTAFTDLVNTIQENI
ncbi:lipase family protein [Marinagarivorans cellulosilyticus]|uniref:Ubiquinone biosynthesis protein n=1 Tax=Marinagarivorans cellulosilyticus TaxID=2721545 RepID=A0AAN1WGU4_9GAMM|nr:lipase family protein [Marinagarivorans cellulosilyticus]BCD97344.1 ubiquinone biosynthesis protein [Marinagarivorans cellulosilyticus]